MKMLTREDIQSFCDEVSQWIVDLDALDELHKAIPNAQLPLKADLYDLDESIDVLGYLILWICCKHKTRAPAALETRIVLAKFKGPWQVLYVRLMEKLEKNPFQKIFDLAS